MKKLIFLFGLINIAWASPVKVKGVLNDVSKSEQRILYTIKDNIDEAFSDGTLIIFDVTSAKKVEIAHIKNLDYNIKSYFIDEENILVSSFQGITVFNLKTRTISKSILRLDKQESLISVRKCGPNFYVTLVNYNNSKLRFAEIDSNSLELKDLKTFPVNILPTDNFFDIFLLKDKVWIMDNGKLHEENASQTFNLDFNKKEGKFVLDATAKAICFLEKGSKGRKLKIASGDKSNPIIVNVPIAGDVFIDITNQKEEAKFITSSNGTLFIIDNAANWMKTSTYEIFKGKKIKIRKSNLHEIEINVNK